MRATKPPRVEHGVHLEPPDRIGTMKEPHDNAPPAEGAPVGVGNFVPGEEQGS